MKRPLFIAGFETVSPYFSARHDGGPFLSIESNCCHGEKYFVPLGVEALHVVILQLDS